MFSKTSGASKKIIVALDGFSSTGKSTLARALANKLLYLHLDTGAMYRAVSLHFLREGVDWRNIAEVIQALNELEIGFQREVRTCTLLNGENVEDQIRSMEVSEVVSEISAIASVREVVVEQQREIGRGRGIVMEGRDIGTVVFPDAELKIFLTANKSIRAQRRFLELQNKGVEIDLESVMDNLHERDKLDSEREHSPLKMAEDARLLDNSELDHEEQLAIAFAWCQEILKRENELH